MAFDADWYRPLLGVAREPRERRDPWREQAEMIAVEPTTVPHSLGLTVAEEEGQARRHRARRGRRAVDRRAAVRRDGRRAARAARTASVEY